MTGYNIIHSMLIRFSFLRRIQASFEWPDFNDTEVDSVSKLPYTSEHNKCQCRGKLDSNCCLVLDRRKIARCFSVICDHRGHWSFFPILFFPAQVQGEPDIG